MIHPAKQVDFITLLNVLNEENNNGMINSNQWDGLTIYSYNHKCQANNEWNLYRRVARGLIVSDDRIVALPFPKFFNYQEVLNEVPELDFTTFEKVDGSLCIIFYWNGDWRVATRGSFVSDQAIYAKSLLNENIDKSALDRDYTYLAELTSPKFQIVIPYSQDNLTLLGAYNIQDGYETNFSELQNTAQLAGFALPQVYQYDNLDEICRICKDLPKDDEGFVVKFSDGFRVKIKGEEYLRIHKIISNLTPLSIWESILNKDDMDAIRNELPEDLKEDFDKIYDILEIKRGNQLDTLLSWYNYTYDWSNKDIGLMFKERDDIPEVVRSLLFHCRNNGFEGLNDPNNRMRIKLFKLIRPSGNVLDGYDQNARMQRVVAEAV